MSEEDLVATWTMLQHAVDEDVMSTEHKAEAQPLEEGPARVETRTPSGANSEPKSGATASGERNKRGSRRQADGDAH